LRHGIDRLEGGDPIGAVTAFQKVLKIDSSNGDAYSGIAHAFLDLGEFEGARVALANSLRLKPSDSRYVMLGGVLRRLSDETGALRAFRAALRLSPTNAEAIFNIADLLQSKRPKTAVAMFRRALEIEPDSALYRLELASLLNRRREYRAAERILRRAIELEPQNKWLWIELGNSLWMMGSKKEAERTFRETSDRFRDAPEPMWTWASYLEKDGQFDLAERLFRRAVDVAPKDEIAHSALDNFRIRQATRERATRDR
jgi:Flp pilus assembly protein TadD